VVAVASTALDHMQITCIFLQTDNHASTSPLPENTYKIIFNFYVAMTVCWRHLTKFFNHTPSAIKSARFCDDFTSSRRICKLS